MESSPNFRRVALWPMVKRLVMVSGTLAMVPLLFLFGCQSSLIYFPRSYPVGLSGRWASETPGRVVDFKTSQGDQRAFLQGRMEQPQRLWIVCGGNATVALEWSDWLARNARKEDAFLLVDFPGYGDCEGSPNPQRIAETLRTVVPLACEAVGWSGVERERLRVFGHSLGAAACLIAAAELDVRRGVLLSPFTSTMDMTREIVGLPLGFLVTHRFDNPARLAEIAEKGGGKLIILHGTEDEVIPVSMSRQLAAAQPELVTLREIPGGRHNSLQLQNTAEIVAAMAEVAE
jgi:pimeloyl-ACP methyl ester carboxylesterase